MSFLFWVLEKVLKSVNGQGWRVGVCGFPLRWERAQDVVEEVLWRSPSASVITGVTEPLPICVPNKERPPSWRLLPHITLHLSLFIYPTFCLNILPFPCPAIVLIFTLVWLATEGFSESPVCRCWLTLGSVLSLTPPSSSLPTCACM